MNDGQATITVNTLLGSFSTNFDFAQEVGEELTEFLTGVTGTLGVGGGQLTSNLVTSVGSFQGTIDVNQIVNNLIPTFPLYNGTLIFSGGQIIADLTTPYGDLDGAFNYGQYLDDIALLFA
ncbi:MAG: hypothetical protein HC866_24760 [Leptolyngbyaceae cyanobacterium RU_5_1]|nr:hypothetical protein [Leptolyngbyaceae cyanobacterium RU_5_1]